MKDGLKDACASSTRKGIHITLPLFWKEYTSYDACAWDII
jgi:hypothetical protein